jgi:hypothetical protein
VLEEGLQKLGACVEEHLLKDVSRALFTRKHMISCTLRNAIIHTDRSNAMYVLYVQEVSNRKCHVRGPTYQCTHQVQPTSRYQYGDYGSEGIGFGCIPDFMGRARIA